MSDKKLDEELLAMFANTKMEDQQSYLLRGRIFQKEDIALLTSSWLAQINAWADGKDEFERKRLDDIEAEFGVRGIDTPVERARDAIEKIRAKARAVGERWKSNPEEHEQAEELIQAELAKIRPSETDKN
jgi:hypothetical protein